VADDLMTLAGELARETLRRDDLRLTETAEADDRVLRRAEAKAAVPAEPTQVQPREAASISADDLAQLLDRLLGRLADQGRYVP